MKTLLLLIVAGTSLTVHAEEEKTFTNGTGQKMIWVPAGSFRMGDLTGKGKSNGKPVRTVKLSGYYLAATEVTQGQWEAVMGTTLRQQEAKKQSGNIVGESHDHPMYFVNWDDAMEYCRKLTKRERAAGRLPEGYEYTLPTEAQWEKACRAGTNGDHAGDLGEMAWYQDNSGSETHPVAKKKPNAWGFHDMHGNVWEWCLDWHSDPYDASDTRDPRGPAPGSLRVLRGGGWSSRPSLCRSADRWWGTPGYRYYWQGFRPALSLANRISKGNDPP